MASKKPKPETWATYFDKPGYSVTRGEMGAYLQLHKELYHPLSWSRRLWRVLRRAVGR